MMSTLPSITYGGQLGSSGIVEQLVALQRQPIDKMGQKISTINSKKNTVTQLQNKFNSLKTTLKRLTSTSVLDSDLFQAKKGSSTNEDILTITASDKAAVQGMNVKVKALATSTTAKSVAPIGQVAAGTTTLAGIKNVSFEGGNVSILVNGQLNTIAINRDTDTIDTVLGKLSSVAGISSATIDGDGLLNIQSTTPSDTIQFGSSGDTSNFFRLTRLNTATKDAGGLTKSSFRLTTLDTAQTVSGGSVGLQTPVTSGSTFTVGSASFDTTSKTLAQIVAEINNSDNAGVSATINNTTGRLDLTSKKQGNLAITLKDDTGNFLQAVGLISGSNTTASQTMGSNAEIELNGTSIFSNSNTVDESVSGLTGVTLNLKTVSATAVGVNIARDTEPLTTKLGELITQLNDVLSAISTQTNLKTGNLAGNSTLNNLRSQIRSNMGSSINNPNFTSLMSVGIGTGATGSFAAGGAVNTAYSLDSTKLVAALNSNAGSVKSLFSDSSTGILSKINTLVTDALKTGASDAPTENGAFQNITNTFDSQVKTLNKSIEASNKRLVTYQLNLQRQFASADSMISQYQSQASSLSSMLG